ncbi:624_t:CDS:2 [Cetraspora pellucida]|uniref:624_t:CDS:1 n=1 Tax=Cetraspora pellucida TaxID=1433469 RepID=A0A9N9DM33_9GLOM|nr:624_t:CDS:2 [Cetraspora pellucida]
MNGLRLASLETFKMHYDSLNTYDLWLIFLRSQVVSGFKIHLSRC